MQVNDRVKHSDHVIRSKRDYMLGCSATRKAKATRWLNEAKAERGTVVGLIPQRDDLAAARARSVGQRYRVALLAVYG